MIKPLFTLLLTFASMLSLHAQDAHFTQFYASPLLLNPALTGGFDGQLRASTIYRDQYSGVVETPFTTTAAALDFRFPLKLGGRNNGDAASAGIVFMNDRVKEFDFVNNQIMVSGAYHKMLDKRTNQILSGGIQLGIGQRNINYNRLSFQDEFSINPNGSSGFFGSTREDLPTNNITFFDANVGINYSYAPRGGVGLYAGVAVHHINEPDISFFSRDDDSLDPEPLRRKYGAHVAGVIPISGKTSLQPRALFLLQGESALALAGSNIRFQFDEFSSTALHLGSWVRAVRDFDGVSPDAVIALVGIEYHNFLLGTTYDVGLSDFTNGSRGRGALEISIAYLGSYENDSLLCPQF
jgi:type IX secretion system PorP/SprF family membrane protein